MSETFGFGGFDSRRGDVRFLLYSRYIGNWFTWLVSRHFFTSPFNLAVFTPIRAGSGCE